jgi:hypothetical protein
LALPTDFEAKMLSKVLKRMMLLVETSFSLDYHLNILLNEQNKFQFRRRACSRT